MMRLGKLGNTLIGTLTVAALVRVAERTHSLFVEPHRVQSALFGKAAAGPSSLQSFDMAAGLGSLAMNWSYRLSDEVAAELRKSCKAPDMPDVTRGGAAPGCSLGERRPPEQGYVVWARLEGNSLLVSSTSL